MDLHPDFKDLLSALAATIKLLEAARRKKIRT
jgi:hypothetical protein